MEVRIERITSVADIPACAQLCYDAVVGDPLLEYMDRHGGVSFYDETVTRISDAIAPTNTTDFAFKAVMNVPDGNGGTREEIVGVTHWFYGYVQVPKVDPLNPQKIVQKAAEIPVDDVVLGSGENSPSTPTESQMVVKNSAEAMAELSRQHGNAYVGTIRGKKHIYLRRMMVHPKHQRRGIGRKLIQWGLDRADDEKIVAYLNARPAARKLYLAAGFQPVAELEFAHVQGHAPLSVPPLIPMLRQPQSRSEV